MSLYDTGVGAAAAGLGAVLSARLRPDSAAVLSARLRPDSAAVLSARGDGAPLRHGPR